MLIPPTNGLVNLFKNRKWSEKLKHDRKWNVESNMIARKSKIN